MGSEKDGDGVWLERFRLLGIKVIREYWIFGNYCHPCSPQACCFWASPMIRLVSLGVRLNSTEHCDMIPNYWTEATQHLSLRCPTMATLIAGYPLETLIGRGDAFYTLLRSIVGQQISVKAADTVWGRLEAKVKLLVPAKVARVRDTTLRAVGLSAQKVSYCKNLARFFLEHVPSDGVCDYWGGLSDEVIVKQLTSIKGIGVWTVEMFLIFHLQRPDIYPLQDIGMIKAIEKHFAEGRKLTKTELVSLGERWRPFRSVATWYLWRSLDPVPVVY